MKAYFFCRKHYNWIFDLGFSVIISRSDFIIAFSLIFWTIGFCIYKDLSHETTK